MVFLEDYQNMIKQAAVKTPCFSCEKGMDI